MKKYLAEKIYKKINELEYVNRMNIPKEDFIKAMEEEIEFYANDTQAEIGMGMFTLIIEKRKYMSDTVILDSIINLCKGLINKSPECALEFSKQMEGNCA